MHGEAFEARAIRRWPSSIHDVADDVLAAVASTGDPALGQQLVAAGGGGDQG